MAPQTVGAAVADVLRGNGAFLPAELAERSVRLLASR